MIGSLGSVCLVLPRSPDDGILSTMLGVRSGARESRAYPRTENRLVFLGSGGARIVTARQLRATGGIWFSLAGSELLVDPGPGALVRMTSSRHGLDPSRLNGVLLSHRHLDHAGDINNVIEAMTVGGTKPGGELFAPSDALEGEDPVVLRYLRPSLSQVIALEEHGKYQVGSVRFCCPVRHRHRGEVYGFRFEVPGLSLAYIADTAYFPDLAEHYRAEIMILNVVRRKPSKLDHLHMCDAHSLIEAVRPRLAIITHFGMTMLRARPWEMARQLTRETGVQVMAASDDRLILLDRTGGDDQTKTRRTRGAIAEAPERYSRRIRRPDRGEA